MDRRSIRSNKNKWRRFLSSIKSFKNEPKTDLIITTKRNIKCLATKFANKLIQEKGGTVVLRGKRDVLIRNKRLDVKKVQPVRDNILLVNIEIPGGDILHVSADVDIVCFKDGDTPNQSMKKDMDKSCSKWSISNIAKYLSFNHCVIDIKIPTRSFPNLDYIFGNVNKDIRLRLKTVKCIYSKARKNNSNNYRKQLKSITCTETGSRLVLDALLVPLCSALDLQIEVNKSINCTFLPNCTFDYCIRKKERIIGCIEAKSVKGLSSKSIAQVVLQLMILQTTLIATETPTFEFISEFPFFAIVSDGHRFIYMQLKGSSLGFERDGGKLRIREVRKKRDFNDILQHINFLGRSKDGVTLID